MEINYSRFIAELADRSWTNYDYIRQNCKKEGLNEVTQLINSMYCMLVVPEEIFGYKNNGDEPKSDFSALDENIKDYSGYSEIQGLINKLKQDNRIKYDSESDYVLESPVSSLLYNMRNALCHDGIGFLPINSHTGENEITDIIFLTKYTKSKDVKFAVKFEVDELVYLLENVKMLYADIESVKRFSKEKEYRRYYQKIKREFENFFKQEQR